ncbi:MAG: hypothetical protein KG075_17835 [Alphaproteobacteria bacterium]|nr:hypothetical protein [Alphaproteobacteria bacterium]
MAVGPSSNLLSALSQLQNNRPVQPPRPAQTATAAPQTAPTQKTSFAAQLGSIGTSIQVAASEQRSASPAPVQSQQRPIQTRGGLLGQHINIVV